MIRILSHPPAGAAASILFHCKDDIAPKIADHREQEESYNYLVSLAPTFGMNSILVGGDYHGVMSPTGLAVKRFGKFCVTRMSEAHTPSRLILFASAHYLTADSTYYGYHTATTPSIRRISKEQIGPVSTTRATPGAWVTFTFATSNTPWS